MNSKMNQSALQDEEIQIVQKAVCGDQQAFTQLFDRYYAPINRYFYFHLSNQQDVDDLTNMVFLKTWQNLQKFKQNKGTFKAWLYRIAHNLLIDFYRRPTYADSVEEIIEIEADIMKPENLIVSRQEIYQLRLALAELDERSRSVIIHRFIAGLDHHETARLLGLSEGNVRVIQLRSLKKIKDFFAEDCDE